MEVGELHGVGHRTDTERKKTKEKAQTAFERLVEFESE